MQRSLPLLAVALVLSGCATILNGPRQTVTVDSDPAGAEVFDNGLYVGRTPAMLALKRQDSHTLRFRLEGYEDQDLRISRSLDALPVAGSLFLGPMGLLVDFASGSAYALDTDYAYVTLEPLAGGGPDRPLVERGPDRPLAVRPQVRLAEPVRTGARRQSGPRFGLTYLSPGVVDRINEVLSDGEDDEDVVRTPLTTQFGWQFETQTFQAENGLTGVIEFVPLIGGLERGRFFPTATLIAGARTPSGLEFGVGPNVSLTGLGSIEDGSDDRTGIAVGLALVGGQSIDVGGANVPINGAVVLGESGARISLLIGLTTSRGRY